jgi:hypothetical protein
LNIPSKQISGAVNFIYLDIIGITMPKLKKTIAAFLLEEDGKIRKKAVISLGAALAVGALSSVSAGGCQPNPAGTKFKAEHCWSHSNAATAPSGTITGHNHHYNHGSHASHSSHGSHGSGGGT